MDKGDNLVLSVDNLAPKFQDLVSETTFDANKIFDFDTWRDPDTEIYKKVIRDEEYDT
jgi:hypothetical protein